eukprot:jgi/Chlat1/6473/Chrsp45S00470
MAASTAAAAVGTGSLFVDVPLSGKRRVALRKASSSSDGGAVVRVIGVRAEQGGGSKGPGLLGRLGRVFKEKAKADLDRVFNGMSRTRQNLAVIDELVAFWKLNETDDMLDELEEALLVADFGPSTALKIVDEVRQGILRGKVKSGSAIKSALKQAIVDLLEKGAGSSSLQLDKKPSVIMVVGVNGGGKTTTIAKLAHMFAKDGTKVLLCAGDTFRAAAVEQLGTWAERAGAQFYSKANSRPATVLYEAVQQARAKDSDIDVVICDTSGRLHTNDNLMEELSKCKRSIAKAAGDSGPEEVLLVLDGTTGLNMLNQAREFKEKVGVTGIVLTKLDGTARGGCVVSVVDELKIPVKFVGVGEAMDDLQPFDPATFVEALFPQK